MESNSIADLQDFLNKYPMGTAAHLDAVRQRKHELEATLATEPVIQEDDIADFFGIIIFPYYYSVLSKYLECRIEKFCLLFDIFICAIGISSSLLIG